MGRVTYEAMAAISASGAYEDANRLTGVPKLVFSRTLREPLGWANTRLVASDVAEAIRSLKEQPGDPLRSMGSPSLVKSLLRLGLVDRLRLVVFPQILGATGGEPIFAASRTSTWSSSEATSSIRGFWRSNTARSRSAAPARARGASPR